MGFAEIIKSKIRVTSNEKNYQTEREKESGNPFLSARMEYQDRYGSAVKDAARWRRHSIILLSLCVVFACAMVWLAAQNKVVPYIVQVDRHGYAVAIKSAEEGSSTEQRLIISTIGRLVMDLRTIVSDSEAQKKMIDNVYACVASKSAAYAAISEYYNTNNPLALAKELKIGRTVNITSVTPFTQGGKGNSWLVIWTEQTTNEGHVISAATYRAIVQTAITPVRELDKVIMNPLGIYLTEINVTKDIT